MQKDSEKVIAASDWELDNVGCNFQNQSKCFCDRFLNQSLTT